MVTRRLTAAAAELTVASLSIVAVLSLNRLFTDRTALYEMLTVAVLGHIVAISTRHAGLRTVVAAPLSVAVTVLAVKLLLYPETANTPDGISDAYSLMRSDLGAAWDLFQSRKAPVEPLRGLVTVAAAALGLNAFVTDWAAFRLRSVVETLLGVTAVFVFASLLSGGDRQIAYGALYAAAAGTLIMVMRAVRRSRDEVWLAAGTARGVTATGIVGCATILAAVTVGATVGPAVPGAGDNIVDLDELDEGSDVRAVVSPLVEIQPLLVNDREYELFSVKVDESERDYWRLMALTEFDGALWRRQSSFSDADGRVPAQVHPDVPKRTLRQEITTRRLGNVYLPAAYEVHRVIDSADVVLEYEPATGALVVDRSSADEAARGFSYVIESAVPVYDEALLPARAGDGADEALVAEHTQLPAACENADSTRCWPERATALARRITQAAGSDYEKALALQAFFAGPDSDFVYDQEVARSHDIETLSDFLFSVRRGYCEQFATAFAGLARSLGIPSRVAVGFTWGDWDPGRNEYVVKGKHAHAWVELYFAGAGWIAFDPTPGRGPAHGISDRPAAQLGVIDGPDEPLDDEAAAPADLSPAAPLSDAADAPGSLDEPSADDPADGSVSAPDDAGAAQDDAGSQAGRVRQMLLRAFLVIALAMAAAALAAAVPAAKWLTRRRNLAAAAADPVGLGELAYDDATAALRMAGIHLTADQTPLELADTVLAASQQAGTQPAGSGPASRQAGRARGLRLDPGPVRALAEAVTLLRYAPACDASAQQALKAQQAAAAIRRSCRAHAGSRRRLIDLFDPRPLIVSLTVSRT